MDHDTDERRIIHYLLGGSSPDDVELCDDDALAIEKQYLTDPAFFQLMLTIEDELIQSYANHELAPDERARFEEKYSGNADVAERVWFLRNLSSWAEKDQSPREF